MAEASQPAAQKQQQDPPLPPPLPPARTSVIQRIIAPLGLSRSWRSQSDQPSQSSSLSSQGQGHLQSTRTRVNRTVVHKTGIPIAAIDINDSGTHAILAGRDLLRTVKVQDHSITEHNNLRTAVTSHIASQQLKADEIHKRKEFLPAKDVRWSHGRFSHIIATAASNGRIALFDVNATTTSRIELAWIYQHTGQVNKIDFDPHKGYMLLSGSQDKYCKIWDIRDPRRPAGYNQYNVRAPVRDVRWSPTDAYIFALCTENGMVQKWDLRQPSQPQLSFNAHEKSCYVIDWHPDGKHIASGGFDKHLKVWDFQGVNRRPKPILQVRTPQAIMNLAWRPAHEENRPEQSGAYQCVQIATSYVEDDPRIHVWDLRRPHMPFRELDRYDTRPSDMLWVSKDILWTAGGAGIFRQNDMDFAQTPADELPPSSIEWLDNDAFLSVLANDAALAVDHQNSSGFSLHPSSIPAEHLGNGDRRTSRASSISPAMASSSLPPSDAVDEVSFDMNAMFETRSRRRRTASMSFAGFSSGTPPPLGTVQTMVSLDKALAASKDNDFVDQECTVNVSEVLLEDARPTLVEHALSAPSTRKQREQNSSKILQRLGRDLEDNARKCETDAMVHDASIWSHLRAVVVPELQEYADRNRAQRLGLAVEALVPSSARLSSEQGSVTQQRGPQRHPSPFPKVKTQSEGRSPAISVMSSLFRGAAPTDGNSRHDANRESTSNAPTPLALPQSDYNTTPRRSVSVFEYDAIEPLHEPLPPSVAQLDNHYGKNSLGSLLYPRSGTFSVYSQPVAPSLSTQHSITRSFSVSPVPSDNSDHLIERLSIASGVSRSSRGKEDEQTDASQSFRSQSSIFAMEANTPSIDGRDEGTGVDISHNGESRAPASNNDLSSVSHVAEYSIVNGADTQDPEVTASDGPRMHDTSKPDVNPYLQWQNQTEIETDILANEIVSTDYIADDFRPIDITDYRPPGAWADSAYPLICRILAEEDTHVSVSAHILAHLYPFFFAHSSRSTTCTSASTHNNGHLSQDRDQDEANTLGDKFMAPSTSNRLIEAIFAAHLDWRGTYGGGSAQKFDFRRLVVEDFGFTNLRLGGGKDGELVRDESEAGTGIKVDRVQLVRPSPAVQAATKELKRGGS